MSMQIEEIMELVNVLTTAVHIAASKYAVEGDTEEVQALIQCKQKARKNLEAKLIELVPGWQPIESAPKDGTEVLCWREDCGKFIAKYTSADNFPLTQAEIDAFDEETLFSKDWFTQWPQAIRLDGSETPTHWMPLQKDPE